jgi:hypothetical protein
VVKSRKEAYKAMQSRKALSDARGGNCVSRVADVPAPRPGRRHGAQAGAMYWPCGHSICAACVARLLGSEQRCRFRDEEGRRCVHVTGHRTGDPIPDHLVLPLHLEEETSEDEEASEGGTPVA